MHCFTLSASRRQQFTRTRSCAPSTQLLVSRSKRRAVVATLKLVTVVWSFMMRRTWGLLSALPTIVTGVSNTSVSNCYSKGRVDSGGQRAADVDGAPPVRRESVDNQG